MTSMPQIEANRRNARLSTGPNTEEGKRSSRRNAVRHGLTAETVIDALEDAEDYAAFQMAVTSDYDARSAVERELVLRLAGLLWRLRRATAIETGLLKLKADQAEAAGNTADISAPSRKITQTLFAPPDQRDRTTLTPAGTPKNLAQCFLGVVDLPNFAFD